MGNVLVLARTGLIFAVGRKGHGQDPELIQYHLTSLLGTEGRTYFPGRRGPSWASTPQHSRDPSNVLLFCSNHSTPSLPSVIGIVAVTASFLISFLFPLNCSYLNS